MQRGGAGAGSPIVSRTAQFFGEVQQFFDDQSTGETGITEALAISLLSVAAPDIMPYWLRAWGSSLARTAVTDSTTASAIQSTGLPTSPYKLRITPDGGGLPDPWIVDVGTGVSVMVPPCRNVNIELLAPSGTVLVPANTTVTVPAAIDAWDTLVSVSAVPLPDAVSQVRRIHCTRTGFIAAAGALSMQVPPHTRACTVYGMSQNYAGAVGLLPLATEWQYDSSGVLQSYGLGSLDTYMPKPGQANNIVVYGNPAGVTAFTAVFELEV